MSILPSLFFAQQQMLKTLEVGDPLPPVIYMPKNPDTFKVTKGLYVFIKASDECFGWCPFHWYNPFDWFRKKEYRYVPSTRGH